MTRKRTSRRARPRRNPDRRVAALAAELYALILDAAEDRMAGRSDRWLDAQVERIAGELLAAGLTAKEAADVVIGAYDVGAKHQRRRMAANRRRRARR